jgi:hypothetical protein
VFGHGRTRRIVVKADVCREDDPRKLRAFVLVILPSPTRAGGGTMSSPQELLEKKLNVGRAVAMLVAGAVILAIDGGEMRWRIGGRNGAPAAYLAYIFVTVGLVWSIFAIKGLVQARKETR